MRVLSGIQPSGELHIGNYFGMMKPMIEYQDRSELFCFIVNYHAMTSVTEAERLSSGTLRAALDFLSLGLDPEKAIDSEQRDPCGPPVEEPFLQRQGGARHSAQSRAADLSRSHGGRYSPLSD